MAGQQEWYAICSLLLWFINEIANMSLPQYVLLSHLLPEAVRMDKSVTYCFLYTTLPFKLVCWGLQRNVVTDASTPSVYQSARISGIIAFLFGIDILTNFLSSLTVLIHCLRFLWVCEWDPVTSQCWMAWDIANLENKMLNNVQNFTQKIFIM